MNLHIRTLVPLLWVPGGCLEIVWRVSAGVWRVSGGCLEGVLRVSGRCLEGVIRVSGGYLWDVRMVCGVSRCI